MSKILGKTEVRILCGLVTTGVVVFVFYFLYQIAAYRWFSPTGEQIDSWLAVVSTATSVKLIDTKDFTTLDVTAKDKRLQPFLDATMRSIESRSGYPSGSLPRRWIVIYTNGKTTLVAEFNGKHMIIEGYHFHILQSPDELAAAPTLRD